MRKLALISYVILLIINSSCNITDNSFRDRFRWISGKWEGKLGETTIVEQWKWNKFRFEGHSYSIANGDTVDSELLFLQNFGSRAGYTVVVNDQGPFTFSLTKENPLECEFVNTDHDFPSLIRYTVLGDTALGIDLLPNDKVKETSLSYRLKRSVR